jgi:hypothetical protein
MLGRRGHRREDNNKIDLKETELDGGLDSSGKGQGPVACCGEHDN